MKVLHEKGERVKGKMIKRSDRWSRIITEALNLMCRGRTNGIEFCAEIGSFLRKWKMHSERGREGRG